jgi:hypothetical protein
VNLELRDKQPVWILSRAELHALLTFSTKDPRGVAWIRGVYLLYESATIVATNGARMLTACAPEAVGTAGKSRVSLPRALLTRLFWVMDDQDEAEITLSEGRALVTLVHEEAASLQITMGARTGDVPERVLDLNKLGTAEDTEGGVPRIHLGHRYLTDLTKLIPVLGDTLEVRFYGDEFMPFVVRGKARDGSIWCATVMPKRGEIGP